MHKYRWCGSVVVSLSLMVVAVEIYLGKNVSNSKDLHRALQDWISWPNFTPTNCLPGASKEFISRPRSSSLLHAFSTWLSRQLLPPSHPALARDIRPAVMTDVTLMLRDVVTERGKLWGCNSSLSALIVLNCANEHVSPCTMALQVIPICSRFPFCKSIGPSNLYQVWGMRKTKTVFWAVECDPWRCDSGITRERKWDQPSNGKRSGTEMSSRHAI